MLDFSSGTLGCVVSYFMSCFVNAELRAKFGKKCIKGDLIDSCKESIKQMSMFC